MKMEFEGVTVISVLQVLQLKLSSTASTSSIGFVVGATAGSVVVRPDSCDHLVCRWLRPGLSADVDEVMYLHRKHHDATRQTAKFFLKFRLIPRSRKI
jgi:hypothetical protein